MSQSEPTPAPPKTGLSRMSPLGPMRGFVEQFGALTLRTVDQVGASALLLLELLRRWIWRSMTRPKVRLGRPAIVSQLVRVGAALGVHRLPRVGVRGADPGAADGPAARSVRRKDLAANILGVAILRSWGR